MRSWKTILPVCVLLFMLSSFRAYACTSAVISSRASADGRPLLWKHRDTGELDNSIAHFRGPSYSFVSLVNSGTPEGESWIGCNTAGFAIMNTASYNIKDDDVPQEMMDREGFLMHHALGLCASLGDFETMLDTLPRPLGVEAEFGVIDSHGGAAVYEVNNHSWVKYDVNDPDTAPDGYMVVTNFSFSGREEDRKGYERYLTADAVCREAFSSGTRFTPEFIFDSLSRSYRHEFMGIDYSTSYDDARKSGFCNGIVPDQDFIPRRSTSASVVVHGVNPGEPLSRLLLWTVLGYPLCAPAVPVPVSEADHVPHFMKKGSSGTGSMMCGKALSIKGRYVFRFHTSSGLSYLDMDHVLSGKDGFPSLLSCCRKSDADIRSVFMPVYMDLLSGNTDVETYLSRYDAAAAEFWRSYNNRFVQFDT